MKNCYNPLDTFHKSVIGALKENRKITFRVKGDFDSVLFVFKKDGQENLTTLDMSKENQLFSIELSFERGLYFYCFKTQSGYISCGENLLAKITKTPNFYQLTVYDDGYIVPNWLQGGIIYQIFPDRFNKAKANYQKQSDKIYNDNWGDDPIFLPNEDGKVLNNDFFGGNLKGIIEKLDYLKGLNIRAIYLNPIFESYSNHRYDTGDYMSIDSLLGNESDLIELINKANEFGIKIILDGVFNHTGDDSLYFNKYGKYHSIGAYSGKNSPYYDWYNFKQFPNDYECWWGIKTLPNVNENSKSYVEFITGKDGVLSHYTKLGLGGWRLDVVDELPTEFVRKIRQCVKGEKSDAIIIGEVWEDATNKISYQKRREYFQGFELDSVMNYPLKNAIIDYVLTSDSNNLLQVVLEQIDHYPECSLHSLMNILSTHDTARILSRLTGINYKDKSKIELSNIKIDNSKKYLARQRLKIASLLQYTLYGVPSLYYGDEAGLEGFIDPLNRRCYPWGKEDKELYNWYKKLGEIRKENAAFTNGKFDLLHQEKGFFAFARTLNNNQVGIVTNTDNDEYTLNFNGKLKDLLTDQIFNNTITVKGLCALLLVKP